MNEQLLQKYVGEYTDRVCTRFFSENDVVDNNNIIRISQIRQVLFFVGRSLFEEWKKYVDPKIKPYYNLFAPEIVRAKNDFAELLSEHVQIQRENAFPLLQSAVENTLILTFSPNIYYERELQRLQKDVIDPEHELHIIEKYTWTHVYYKEVLLNALKAAGNALTLERALEICEAIRIKNHVDDPEFILRQFNEEAPLDIEEIFPNCFAQLGLNLGRKTRVEELQSELKKENIELDEVQKRRAMLFKTDLESIRQAKPQPLPVGGAGFYDDNVVPLTYRHDISEEKWLEYQNILFGGSQEALLDALNTIYKSKDFGSVMAKLKKDHLVHKWDLGSSPASDFFAILDKRF